MALTITTNTEATEYNDMASDSQLGVDYITRWLAEKYGVPMKMITVAQLVTHLCVMSVIAVEQATPEATDGDVYDATRDEITSAVLVYSAD